MKDASEILDSAESRQERVQPHVRDAAELFHDEEGTLFTRSEALEMIQDECGIGEDTASDILAELVGDTVDPVVQVIKGGVKYIGVIEFHEFDGAYGYVQWHDEFGARKRVVCQQCVNEAKLDKEVKHATEGMVSFPEDTDFDTLLDAIHEHYQGQWDEDEKEYVGGHDVMPEEVETGASLASGSTAGGNTIYTTGNAVDAADLNFDTATQNELDNHAADANAHHSPPNVPVELAASGSNVSGAADNILDYSTYNAHKVYVYNWTDGGNTTTPKLQFRSGGATLGLSNYTYTVQIDGGVNRDSNASTINFDTADLQGANPAELVLEFGKHGDSSFDSRPSVGFNGSFPRNEQVVAGTGAYNGYTGIDGIYLNGTGGDYDYYVYGYK